MAVRNAREEAQRATTAEEQTAYTLELLQKMLRLSQPPRADGVLRHLQHRQQRHCGLHGGLSGRPAR